ncbi:hypothetical protein M011DRAFT_264747 [Sporormia fimetaria CBS 119925]|uniref:Uncharacterized protein n=1 Tax=Sporormia fimetaria CBS 119925 TaxID=1340428 RepID=A0A6A6UZN2_9PLEO|nr:hypothetical protein M011DRAFT_264747 [Sporormia fimetaria CBS 119925]
MHPRPILNVPQTAEDLAVEAGTPSCLRACRIWSRAGDCRLTARLRRVWACALWCEHDTHASLFSAESMIGQSRRVSTCRRKIELWAPILPPALDIHENSIDATSGSVFALSLSSRPIGNLGGLPAIPFLVHVPPSFTIIPTRPSDLHKSPVALQMRLAAGATGRDGPAGRWTATCDGARYTRYTWRSTTPISSSATLSWRQSFFAKSCHPSASRQTVLTLDPPLYY